LYPYFLFPCLSHSFKFTLSFALPISK
jgi:hypothetical protein